jgi:hypothetical protein
MPRYIITGAVVQSAVIIRAMLSLGCTAALLSAICIPHVAAAQSKANEPTKWIDPDRAVEVPLVAATTGLPTSTSSAIDALSWNLLDDTTRALTSDQQIRVFKTIESLLSARQFISASRLVERFEGVSLDRSHSALLRLLETKTLYMSGEYKTALKSLRGLQNRDLSPRHQSIAVWLEIGSLLGVRKISEALQTARHFAVGPHHSMAASLYEIVWNTLVSMPTLERNELKDSTTDPESIAWLALADLFAIEVATSKNFNDRIAFWQRRNPGHPANRYVLSSINSQTDPDHRRIRRVALLLPISSSFREAAEAIRDGFLFLSAQSDPTERPLIRVYDFGDQKELIHAYYDAAVRDRSEFIVGPVGTAAIKELVRRTQFTIPTLLLGNVDHPDTSRPNTYQFSLSPEDDAAAVADRAFNDGHRRVVAMYPDTAQGYRIFAAWRRRWQEHGGTLIRSHAYETSISDHSQILSALFHLDRSSARRKALQNTLGNTAQIKFLARRRQDIDALFLLGDNYHSRLIKPQIDFHHAHDLTIYSLNSNYTGTPDPVKDLDLEGMLFGDMPWILNLGGNNQNLRKRVTQQQSRDGSVLDRLFALGMDAYGLINNISQLQKNPDLTYPGTTGDLSVTTNGRVLRRLEWFRIRHTQPIHLRLATLPNPPPLNIIPKPND